MTELSPTDCLRSQLAGVVKTQHGTFRQALLSANPPCSSKESFVVISNSNSCRNNDICLCINGYEGQGFVHKSFVSRACSEHGQLHAENKKLKYFALLKEYVSTVTSIKNIICELESFSEEQCSDEGMETETKYSCDLSRVLNILERYRSDMKHFRTLEVRFQSFLKSEMLYLSRFIGLTLSGFPEFILTAEQGVLQSVYIILTGELKNLVRFSVAELSRKDSSWNANCIHLCQLAGKFEKLASAATKEFGKWGRSWRDRVVVFVSKRDGVRSKFPFLYLKNLSQPYLLSYIKAWMVSMGISDNIANFINVRTHRVSSKCLKLLYLLLFKGEPFLHMQQIQNDQPDLKEPDQHVTENQKKEDESTNVQKSMAISIKSFRSKFFQEFWEETHKEEPLISSFIMTLLNSNFNFTKSKSANLLVEFGKARMESSQDRNMDLMQPQNGLSIVADSNKSPGTSKKVQWNDMVNPNFSKETINSHMDSLWKSLSRCFINQLCYQHVFCDKEGQQWDFSLTAMDPIRTAVVLSCLSVKKLRSESGSINPAFNQCARNISAHVALAIHMQRWEDAIRKVEVSALKDKCRISPNATKKYSETMDLILDALEPLQISFALLVSSRGNDMQKLMEEQDYDRSLAMPLFMLSAVLRKAIDWLQTKSQQFVSSGSWEQYLVVTSEDTAVLQNSLRRIVTHVVALSKKIHLMEKPRSMLQQTLEMIQKMFAEIKMIRLQKNEVLISSVKIRTKRALSQHFPDAKQWRKRGSTRVPFEANAYVKVVPSQVLAPVIESVRALDREEADEVLCNIFPVFITSLMDYILEESIKFSSYGANQLCFDFNSFRDWVTRLEPQYLHSDAMSAILADNTFDEFRSVIKLLCCQPESRRRSNPGSVSDTDGASSIGSTTSNGSYNGSIFEPTINQIEVKNKERWLALRVKGGQTKNRLLCISNT